MQTVAKWKLLIHPNTVPFLGVTNNPIHFISAWTPGVQLSEYITAHPDTNRLELVGAPLPISRVTLTSLQLIGIANGLDYLHSRDVIHGDLGGVRNHSKAHTTAMLTPRPSSRTSS